VKEGDKHFEKARELTEELDQLIGDMPSGELGYPLTDVVTCQELREAVTALQRAVDLLTAAVDRETPRHAAVAELIEEQRTAMAN
jgi:hypothetical protein